MRSSPSHRSELSCNPSLFARCSKTAPTISQRLSFRPHCLDTFVSSRNPSIHHSLPRSIFQIHPFIAFRVSRKKGANFPTAQEEAEPRPLRRKSSPDRSGGSRAPTAQEKAESRPLRRKQSRTRCWICPPISTIPEQSDLFFPYLSSDTTPSYLPHTGKKKHLQ